MSQGTPKGKTLRSWHNHSSHPSDPASRPPSPPVAWVLLPVRPENDGTNRPA